MSARAIRDAWILARKAEGLWVRPCLSCGSLFAQPHNGRPGQLCDRRVCILAYRWQRKYGRMPPDSMWIQWRLAFGDMRQWRPTTSLRFAEEA